MAKTIQTAIEAGSRMAPAKFYIKITPDGPYLLYGNPPMDQDSIVLNDEGSSWTYRKGNHFSTTEEPTALCRCGASKNKPYCDGSHHHTDWDPKETASHKPLLEDAEEYIGPTMVLADNEEYCAFARFCDAYGRIWNLVQTAESQEERDLVIHEADHCTAGRLVVWDKETGEIFEPPFDPAIGLIEDPVIKVSGPIWVKGGIRIESSDGSSYEIRNRVTLCRCGQSQNKPFCDGTHVSAKWHDKLPMEQEAEVE